MLTLAAETRALRQLVAQCQRRPAAEAIHELRATARRLEVYLRLARWQVLRAELRRLIRALGPLRDCDVAREARLGGAFEAWRSARRAAEARKVQTLLRAREVRALIDALSVLPPLHRATAKSVRRELEARAELTFEPSFEALHAARRALRRARLARQWLGDDGFELKQRQRLMGVVCDLSCLARLLREFGAEEGAQVCERGVERLVDAFVRADAT